MVGLMATSSKRAYAIPRSVAPRAPAPAAVHWWPVPPQETLRHIVKEAISEGGKCSAETYMGAIASKRGCFC